MLATWSILLSLWVASCRPTHVVSAAPAQDGSSSTNAFGMPLRLLPQTNIYQQVAQRTHALWQQRVNARFAGLHRDGDYTPSPTVEAYPTPIKPFYIPLLTIDPEAFARPRPAIQVDRRNSAPYDPSTPFHSSFERPLQHMEETLLPLQEEVVWDDLPSLCMSPGSSFVPSVTSPAFSTEEGNHDDLRPYEWRGSADQPVPFVSKSLMAYENTPADDLENKRHRRVAFAEDFQPTVFGDIVTYPIDVNTIWSRLPSPQIPIDTPWPAEESTDYWQTLHQRILLPETTHNFDVAQTTHSFDVAQPVQDVRRAPFQETAALPPPPPKRKRGRPNKRIQTEEIVMPRFEQDAPINKEEPAKAASLRLILPNVHKRKAESLDPYQRIEPMAERGMPLTDTKSFGPTVKEEGLSEKKRIRPLASTQKLPQTRKPTGFKKCPMQPRLRRIDCACHREEYCSHHYSKMYCRYCPGRLICPETLIRKSDCHHCAK